ncbi:MAG: peptidase T [Lachnospiraceae bacterium]|nr:peptidase T [Lachnospiraceae bacterium]
MNLREKTAERLMRYARIDTQSSNESRTTPTTSRQFDLARVLKEELESIGVPQVIYDEKNCVVIGKIPGNVPGARSLGLIAHMDVSPDAPSAGVRPWILKDYRGGDIVLNEEKQIVMREADYANLRQYVGDDLILTDGTTLLGADDKAAVSELMTLAEYLLAHPEVPHGLVALAFTPDEEVGGLAKDLDFGQFEAQSAYTVDGDHLGYYADETFYAYAAKVQITGLSVHPGTAKGIMKNAADIACEYMRLLPQTEKPQYTEGREGYDHVHRMSGDCEHAEIELILRDFDYATMQRRLRELEDIADLLNAKYGPGTVTVESEEQYRNMKEIIDTAPHLIANLRQAMQECGIEPKTAPFRGGTDGAALSWRGLPCPNISAGYENAHGRMEYVSVQAMEATVRILIRLCEICGKQQG